MIMKINKRYNRKVIKKILILLSLAISMITIYEIAQIYAVFYSEGSGTISQGIAKWEVVVNDTDIVSETIQTFEIDKLSIQDAEDTNGKLAPGLEGSFEIVINPNNTQVSVRYDIFINDANLVDSDIKLMLVQEIGVNNTIIRTDEKTYTGIMPLSSVNNNDINHIKITFKWDDDEGSNEQYVEVNENISPIIQIPISVKVSQYLGEEIIAY